MAIWSNFTQFLAPDTRLDPVTGQGAPGGDPVAQSWPAIWGVQGTEKVKLNFSDRVKMQGGKYFFLPSLSFFRGAK